MNENQRIDLRIVKTRENIKRAFQKLIKEKTFSKITVTNIIEESKINRSTFYKHYQDKYDLRESLIKETLEDFHNNIDLSLFKFRNNIRNRYPSINKSTIIKNFNYLLESKEWYLTLWSRNMESYVYDDMQQILEKKFKNCVNNNEFNSKYELFIRMLASSSMKNIQWWYDYKDQISVEEMVNINMGFFKSTYDAIWPKMND